VDRQCTQGERCTGTGKCATGLECTGGTCQSTAPKCGDRVVAPPQEQCEIGVGGSTQWTCGPARGPVEKQCKNRTVYTICSSSGSECDSNSSCQTLDGALFQCMPNSGLGLDGVGSAAQVCPALDGYTQGLFSNAFCVIECTQNSDCPTQLPSCRENPLASAGPEEAGSFCTPG
jgi:hypothetical protein